MKIAAWLAIAVLAQFPRVTLAAEPASSDPGQVAANIAQPTTEAASTVAPQGVRAALDPYSGELIEPQMPVEAPAGVGEAGTDALAPMDFSKVRVEHLPDGNVHIELNGQFSMATFARIDSEGRATTWCAPGSPAQFPQAESSASTQQDSKP